MMMLGNTADTASASIVCLLCAPPTRPPLALIAWCHPALSVLAVLCQFDLGLSGLLITRAGQGLMPCGAGVNNACPLIDPRGCTGVPTRSGRQDAQPYKLFFLAFGPFQGWWLLEVCERKTDVGPARFATTCSTPRKRAMPALSSKSSFDFPIPGVIVLTKLR